MSRPKGSKNKVVKSSTKRPWRIKNVCKRNHIRSADNLTSCGACKICVAELTLIWRTDNHEQLKKIGRRSQWKKYKILNLDGSQFTEVNYDIAYQLQDGKCKMCNMHQSELNKRLVPDHDHTTGLFRALLCDFCNKTLGLYEKYGESAKRYIDFTKNILLQEQV